MKKNPKIINGGRYLLLEIKLPDCEFSSSVRRKAIKELRKLNGTVIEGIDHEDEDGDYIYGFIPPSNYEKYCIALWGVWYDTATQRRSIIPADVCDYLYVPKKAILG